MEKPCRACGQVLPLDKFHRNRCTPDGFQAQCKACRLATLKAKRDADPEQTHLQYRKRYWESNREKIRFQRLLRTYGVSEEQYRALEEAQGGRCAICREPETKVDKRYGTPFLLAVDHDHETGAVRGLLCDKCNRGIGLLRDNPDVLMAASDYVRAGWHARAATTRGV